jgi:hypothetical protein
VQQDFLVDHFVKPLVEAHTSTSLVIAQEHITKMVWLFRNISPSTMTINVNNIEQHLSMTTLYNIIQQLHAYPVLFFTMKN